jgi:hypothetical protein
MLACCAPTAARRALPRDYVRFLNKEGKIGTRDCRSPFAALTAHRATWVRARTRARRWRGGGRELGG